jgi:hypothetical protein
MRFITKKHLSRRTLLRGVGTAIALPLLDSMVPAQTPLAKTAANPMRRLGFVYVPHGMIMDKWTPVGDESGFKINEIMVPLAPYQDRLVVVSGTAHKTADNAGPHALSPTTWLSGVRPKATEGEDVYAAETIDQMAAAKIGQDTQFPSMELATEDHYGLIGACDTGYSCTYLNTLSWRTPTTPLPMEINPRVVFERMFGEGGTAAQRAARMEEDRSILDAVTKEAGSFQKDLGAHDRSRISDFLDDIREIERRIQTAQKQSAAMQVAAPSVPVGVPESFEEHCKLMFDLLALAYQADITRVSTFMMARELSQRTYPQVGAPDPHHALSHHQNDPERIAKLVKVQNYHVQMFAHYLQKLSSIQDGQGTLLDHMILLYGGNMSNSNLHNHFPLPVLLAGGGAGQLKGNRHVKCNDHTPMSNVLMTLLDKIGIPMDHVGDSNGLVADL